MKPNPIDDCLNKLQIKDYLLRQNELLPDRVKAKQLLLAEILKVVKDYTAVDELIDSRVFRQALTRLFGGEV